MDDDGKMIDLQSIPKVLSLGLSIPLSADGKPKTFEIVERGTTKNADILVDNEGMESI